MFLSPQFLSGNHSKVFSWSDITGFPQNPTTPDSNAPLAWVFVNPDQHAVAYMGCGKTVGLEHGWVWDRTRMYKSSWEGSPDQAQCSFDRDDLIDWISFSFAGQYSIALGYPMRHLRLVRVNSRQNEIMAYLHKFRDHVCLYPKALMHECTLAREPNEWARRLLEFEMCRHITDSEWFRIHQGVTYENPLFV
jgi:hypothetical protein